MRLLVEQKVRDLLADKNFSDIFRGSVWALVAQAGSTALALVINIIIARRYGPEIVGILAMVNSFLTLTTIFTVLGTDASILRLIPEHIAKYSVTSAFKVYRQVQFFVAAVSVATSVVLFLSSSLIADKIFSKPHLSFFFDLSAVFVGFKSIAILNTQAVRGLRLIRTFALMQLLPSFFNLMALLVLTVSFVDQNIPIYALFVSITITAIAGALIMNLAFKKRVEKFDIVKNSPIRDIISLSWPMLMTATMNFVIGQTGVIILGIYRPDAEVGYYSVAVKLATLTAFVLQAINSMSAPKFSELFHVAKMGELFHVAKKSSKMIFWMTAPILISLLVFGRIVLSYFFGHDFVVAYLALIFLVAGQFVNAISGSTGFFMNMTGHEKKFKNIISVAAIINVTFNFLLIPRYGINGAAFSAMVSMIYWNVYTLLYIKDKFGVSIGYMPMLKKR